MAYSNINPAFLVEAVQKWIQFQQAPIQALSLFAGGWEGWARNQFALWLQDALKYQLQNNDPLDVLTEANTVPGEGGGTSVFESPTARADLVFNALSPIGQTDDPVIVVELKCQSPKQRWTAFRSGLTRDVAKLYDINSELDEIFDERGIYAMALGICFNVPDLRPAAGFQVVQATPEYAIQWWSDPALA
ncbi:hypothetical protein [Saccharothrix sp. HUAS TT1]|uniref:hypothetical protein n=1 Tax=unclassified Saccharothrix TaxID=2593673 RepID=UPI00345BE68F